MLQDDAEKYNSKRKFCGNISNQNFMLIRVIWKMTKIVFFLNDCACSFIQIYKIVHGLGKVNWCDKNKTRREDNGPNTPLPTLPRAYNTNESLLEQNSLQQACKGVWLLYACEALQYIY